MQGFCKEKATKRFDVQWRIFYVRCSTHIVNMIVQNGLAMIGGALKKIMDNVKFVKGSQFRGNMFQNCMETVRIQVDAYLILDVITR